MKTTKMLKILVVALGLMVCLAEVSKGAPMGTAFTYQGRLMDANGPADGQYDFEFKLWMDPCEIVYPPPVGDTLTMNEVDVIDGYFTVELDFNSPSAFDGYARWLEISVRPGDSKEQYTILTPRQEVTPTPYALYAKTAGGDNDWMVSVNDMYAIPSGNVGIGTTNPLQKLHISDSGMASLLVHETTNNVAGQLMADTDYVSLQSAFNHPLRFKINDITRVFIDTDGKVGIGTTIPDPSYKLHIKETDLNNNLWIAIDNDFRHSGLLLDCATDYDASVLFRENGTNKFMIQSDGTTDYGLGIYEYGQGFTTVWKNGKVGIGTTSPQAGLHIKGNGWPNSFMYLESNAGEDAGIRLYDGATVKWHMFNNATDDALWIYNSDASHTVFYAEQSTGRVGIGTTSPAAKLHVAGTARVDTLQITGADVAEKFPVSEDVEPGMVVAIDTENQGQLCLSRGAYNRCVAGVVSGANSLPTGAILGNLPGHEDAIPIALNGRVWVYCDSTEKAIGPGDMLTTSLRAGHAMAVTDYTKAHGAVLGKAMTSLEKGQTGLVLTLINLQ
ncbi:MAG: hypothetical protein FVQ85_06165 [Planctomycetes bacterium]|nr:hypothetical protein [Planctomycetota bacterium]